MSRAALLFVFLLGCGGVDESLFADTPPAAPTFCPDDENGCGGEPADETIRTASTPAEPTEPEIEADAGGGGR